MKQIGQTHPEMDWGGLRKDRKVTKKIEYNIELIDIVTL